jgi:ribonuclease Z
MSLSFQVLGNAGRDNALLVNVDSGQAVSRLLFDCGDGCLWQLPFGDVQAIDHLCFSHLHMDHVGGFDTFFRCTFNRTTKENHVWGPPQTAAILQHRFQGFMWNLVGDQQATWLVHELHSDRVQMHRFELAEAFANDHDEGGRPYNHVLQGPGYTVEALLMEHGTPSVTYIVRETARVNVDTRKLAQLGLRPGPWLQRVRGPRAGDEETIVVEGVQRQLKDLQDALIVTTPGESVAYLTDFLLDDAAMDRLTTALQGVGTMICESQYRHADAELARGNYHMTATQAATLARRANVGQLVLFHLSDRYQPDEWRLMLEEAQSIFPATRFPEQWSIGKTSSIS